ncbi:MAG: LysR family transcriptional regulator, partial [Proteocatella sp.]
MDIKNLYTFKAIIEEGSFVNAAATLGYTQSTITFQIRQLEQELGIILFEKIGRKMVLTQAGKNIVPYIHDTIESYEKLKNIGKDYSQICG